MAGTKVSVLTAGAALGGTEALPAVQTAATVKITADQIKTFTSASPTLVTPVLGVATATSVAIGGATIGSNALAVAGTGQITGKVYVGSAAPTSSNYALWKDGSNRLWVNADDTNGTVSVGVADDYGVTYTGPAYAGGRGWRLNSDVTFGWSATNPLAALDTGLSRISAGVIGVGTGTQGSVAGTLQAATVIHGVGAASTPTLTFAGDLTTGFWSSTGGNVSVSTTGTERYRFGSGGRLSVQNELAMGQTVPVPFSFLTAPAANTWQFGTGDAASPSAQTIKFQDVVAGTSNTAGVNATIQAPAGTGTGAGGSFIFQVAPAGSSGSAKNAWVTALTINTNLLATFAGAVNSSILQTSNINNTSNSRTYWTFPASAESAVFITGGTNPLLQFGGTTSSFVAARRNGTTLEVKLADNSAFTNVQGKLTTDTAYTAGDPTTTGYLVVYDSTGTAYRVPALLN